MIDALTRTVVPPKPALWRRWTSLPMFSYYNRLMAVVLLGNAACVLMVVDVHTITVETLSGMVLINLSVAILIRQQYLINALFWLATRVPLAWPLRVRRSAAKVYHFGCTVAQRWRLPAGLRPWSVFRSRAICSSPAAFRQPGCGSAACCSAC